VLLALVIAFVAWKWLRRRHFLRQLRMARISVDELHRADAGAMRRR
jgi:hypothetical protein